MGAYLNMRREGLEPSSLAACAPQTHAYTNSATCAKILLRGFLKNFLRLPVYFSKKIRVAQAKKSPALQTGNFEIICRERREPSGPEFSPCP